MKYDDAVDVLVRLEEVLEAPTADGQMTAQDEVILTREDVSALLRVLKHADRPRGYIEPPRYK